MNDTSRVRFCFAIERERLLKRSVEKKEGERKKGAKTTTMVVVVVVVFGKREE